MKRSPLFIVFEGIDGCGKSTQAELLYLAFKVHEKNVYLTHECSDGPIGKLLRDEFLSGKHQCDERVINQLYVADRLDHITDPNNGLLKHLNSGQHVICDRYVMSSLAYDTYSYIDTPEYGHKLEDIINRNHLNIELLKPDLTIFLSVPLEIAYIRLKGRDTHSVYESVDKMKKISKSYLHAIDILRSRYGMHILTIDGTKTVEEIHFIIWDEVRKMLKGNEGR